MAASSYYTQVYTMFVGYFGRPPSKSGLDYYAGLMDTSGGNYKILVDDFYKSAESTAMFSGMSTEAQVNKVFQNLFGRDAAAAGLNYWTGQVLTGKISLAEMAYTVAYSAAAADKAVLDAKIASATSWVAALDQGSEILAFSKDAGRAAGRAFLNTVTTSTAATTTAVDAAVLAMTTPVVTPSQTFTLMADAPSITEGDSGTKNLTFVLTLDKVPTEAVTVNYQTLTTGSASAGDDFSTVAGTVTFAAGQTVASVTVSVIGDTTFEANETVAVKFSGSKLVAEVSAIGTIINNDVDPSTQSQTFTLTAGIDSVVGSANNDTINGVVTGALSALDSIDGGNGSDTLAVTDTANINVVPSVVVKNVETANLVSGGTISVDASGWTGLTKLTTSGFGAAAVTAAATTATTVTTATLGAFGVTVDGGSDVTISATGVTTGGITVGGTKAPAGKVTVSSTITGASNANSITITGGTTVAVTQSSSNAGATHSDVIVTGGTATTSVSSTATASVVGAANDAFTANDVNKGAASKASTISSVTVDGYTTANIGSNALTTLSLANGSGNIIIDNQAATVVNKTLGLTVNNLTGGTLDDADLYTKLDVNTTGANSTLANVTFGALTDLTVDGSKVLTLTSTAGAAVLSTVAVKGTAGLTATVSQATVTAVDTSATTGTSTITLDATKATFTGGAGKDNVTTSAAAPTKAIALGDGDDSLTLASGTTAVTGAITGGNGTDALSMVAADAVTASGTATFATKVTGFESLTLTGATGAQAVDLAVLGGYNNVTSAASAGTLTLNNLATNGTLNITGDTAGVGYVVAVKDAGSGTSDVLNLNLSKAGLLTAGSVTAASVETINITTADTQTTPTNPLDTLTLVATSAATVKVSGNAGLNLTGAANLALTSLDASGITKGDFTFTSGALAAAAGIKGSATGTNTVTFSAAVNGAVTYTGGTGNDVVTASNGKNNVITLGDGANSVTGTTGNHTITGGTGADTVTLTTGNNTVSLGNGANAFTATTGNNTYTGGTGVDTVSVGAGQNIITLGAGADVVTITTAGANVNVYTTITDAAAGDQIAFTNLGTETFVSSKVTLAGTAVFQDYANAVVAGATQADHSMDGAFGWFQFSGDTYLVQVKHSTAGGIAQSFVNGTDMIVKLTGLVDLSLATGGTTNILTLG